MVHVPSDERKRFVETMAGNGIDPLDIASVLAISLDTLQKYYANELRNGPILANNKVATNLLRQATKDSSRSIPAALFWLRARAGWSDKPTGEQMGEPILGKKQRAQLEALSAGGEGTGWGNDLGPRDNLN